MSKQTVSFHLSSSVATERGNSNYELVHKPACRTGRSIYQHLATPSWGCGWAWGDVSGGPPSLQLAFLHRPLFLWIWPPQSLRTVAAHSAQLGSSAPPAAGPPWRLSILSYGPIHNQCRCTNNSLLTNIKYMHLTQDHSTLARHRYFHHP